MLVNIVQGPNTGKTLDMSTRQAEAAISRGWAKPTADGTPAASPAEVVSVEVDVHDVDDSEEEPAAAGER